MEPEDKNWCEVLVNLNGRIVEMQTKVSAQAVRVMDALERRHDIEAEEARFQALNEELRALRSARDALLKELAA